MGLAEGSWIVMEFARNDAVARPPLAMMAAWNARPQSNVARRSVQSTPTGHMPSHLQACVFKGLVHFATLSLRNRIGPVAGVDACQVSGSPWAMRTWVTPAVSQDPAAMVAEASMV